MNTNRWRGFGLSTLVGVATLAACSVDTSDINFIPDDAFANAQGATGAGDDGDGGDAGGALNSAGSTGKAGNSGKAGSSGKAGNSSGGAGASSGGAGASSGGTTSSAGSNRGGTTGTGGRATAGTDAGGSGGAPPNTCPATRSNPVDPVIDDFDDRDSGIFMRGGREGGWFILNDGTGTQMPPDDPMKPPIPDGPGYDGTGFAMHTQGSGFTVWGAKLATNLLTPPGHRTPCPYDVSAQIGISFYMRASAATGTLTVNMSTTDTISVENGGNCAAPDVCFDNFGFAVTPVPTTWKLVKIPFASMKQVGYGKPVPRKLEQVLGFEFAVDVKTTFDFWIDQVAFY